MKTRILQVGIRSNSHGYYECPECGYVNHLPVTPSQVAILIHEEPSTHTWRVDGTTTPG